MGAHTLIRANGEPLDTAIHRAAGGYVDCALEMSGAASAVVSATRVVRPGGWISLLGIGDQPVTLDLSTDVVMRGLTLHGVVGRRVPATWERTTAYVREKVVDVAGLITHHFALAEIDGAIELMK